MAIADFTAYQTEIARPRRRRRYKSLGNTANTWPWLSTFKLGQDAGSNPTTAVNNLDASSAAALFDSIPATGTPRLAQVEGSMSLPGVILLCDRLAHQGGLSGIVTTEQTTNLPVGPSTLRATDGTGVMAALEIYGQIGNTATTISARYTNSASTANRATPAIHIGGTTDRDQGRFIWLPLQAGDIGVKSVEGVTLAATTATAGNFGVTLFRPLALFGAGTRGQNFLWDAMIGGCGNMPDVTGIFPLLIYFYAGTQTGDLACEFRFLDT